MNLPPAMNLPWISIAFPAGSCGRYMLLTMILIPLLCSAVHVAMMSEDEEATVQAIEDDPGAPPGCDVGPVE